MDSFVKRVAKNNSQNNGGRQKIHQIFLIDCSVLAITLVWKKVHTLTVAQITAYLLLDRAIAMQVAEMCVCGVSCGFRFRPTLGLTLGLKQCNSQNISANEATGQNFPANEAAGHPLVNGNKRKRLWPSENTVVLML